MDKKEKAKKDKKDRREKGNTGEGKVSVVVTVKDDPAGERKLMEALAGQTVGPDEVVVVRAEGERDEWINRQIDKQTNGISLRVVEAGTDCSRGKGRNIGVRMARNEVIAVTDAGCRPHPDWLEKMVAKIAKISENREPEGSNRETPWHTPRSHPIFAIAGGYRVEAKTESQRVMAGFLTPIAKIAKISENREREINRDPAFGYKSLAFLPASRSIMFTKAAWEAVGGYPEEAVSGGEDLEFARRLSRHPEVEMIYCPEALVDWEPPATLREFFRDIVKHTRGNVEVGYWPHLWRNLTVVLRWMAIGIWPWLGIAYLGWIVGKGIKIIKVIKIINIVQIIIVQLAADGGVILGLILGISGILGRLGNIIHKW